jgi:UDP-2-acetamido-3-amino-2,3-dideoxy-glucuronate N-acetyltransferase
MKPGVRIHPTAEVSPEADIGSGTVIWHHVQVREGARIGGDCVLSKGVYVDSGVTIGDRVKIQNYVSVYHGVTIEDGVFCGPHCVFTNDNLPRAVNPDLSLKAADDWEIGYTRVKRGAAIGANATILPKVVIGEWALVGAGAVVTKDVPPHGLVVGNPAQLVGFCCACGGRLARAGETNDNVLADCTRCHGRTEIPLKTWREAHDSYR